MNPIEQHILQESLPPELISMINIVSIQTEQSVAETICAALAMGLEILEDITTYQYIYLKLDNEGRPYNLSGEPIKM